MIILFLSPWYPYPHNNGSKIRIYNWLKSLARNNKIQLISFVRPAEQVDPSGLKGICDSITTIPWKDFSPWRLKALAGFLNSKPRSVTDTYSVEMENCVKRVCQGTQPDLMICSELGTAIYALPHKQIPAILEDIELSIYQDAWNKTSHSINRFRRGLTWIKTSRYVSRLMSNFDACTVVSKSELDLVASIAPDHHDIYLIPNGVDLGEFVTGISPPHPNTLIYTGALTYNANYDAMQYFLTQIFPKILAKVPEATLTITGSIEGLNLSSIGPKDGIIFSGHIPDIRPAVASAWVCVVPLRLGGGTRLKILEAMALGTPVIATPKGAQGLEVTPGEDILIADEPDQFAVQTVRLLRNPELRARLVYNGRRLVETNYGWDTIGDKIEKVVEAAVNKWNSR